MLVKSEAYKVLGLNAGASKNDIERRYSILLKRYRMLDKDNQSSDETIDINMVTDAYNLLMGYVIPQSKEELKEPNELIKKMGIDEKKAKNFFYYYKVHIIIGLIALIVIAFTIKGCVTRVEPDFNIAFVGDIYFSETDILKNTIKAQIPEIKEPSFDGAYIAPESKPDDNNKTPAQSDSSQAYAMSMKEMILFAAADVDIYIVDEVTYGKYAKEGAFVSLDQFVLSHKIATEKTKPYIAKINPDIAEGDAKLEHIYGINITDSKALKESGIAGKEMIACIAGRNKNIVRTTKVLELLLK